jgi:hypothetical protein
MRGGRPPGPPRPIPPPPPIAPLPPPPPGARAAGRPPRSASLPPRPPGAPPPLPAAPAPAASPFSGLPTHHRTVVGGAFDLLTRAAPDIRSASLYAGLVVLLTCAPVAILGWRLLMVLADAGVDLFAIDPTLGYEGPSLPLDAAIAIQEARVWLVLAAVVAGAGLMAASVDSRAIMATVLAGRLAADPVPRREALRRARATFWPIVGASILISIPTGIAQSLVGGLLRGRASTTIDFVDIGAALVVAIAFAPFTYLLAGIVLGRVGPIVSLGRSVTLFKARKLAGLVVALFAFAGQFIVAAGLVAGADLVLRGFAAIQFETLPPALGTAIAIAAILVFAFAVGSLIATVAALEIAPQVLMFVALTHVGPGLQAGDARSERPKILPLPMVVGIGTGLVSLVAGLFALAGA